MSHAPTSQIPPCPSTAPFSLSGPFNNNRLPLPPFLFPEPPSPHNTMIALPSDNAASRTTHAARHLSVLSFITTCSCSSAVPSFFPCDILNAHFPRSLAISSWHVRAFRKSFSTISCFLSPPPRSREWCSLAQHSVLPHVCSSTEFLVSPATPTRLRLLHTHLGWVLRVMADIDPHVLVAGFLNREPHVSDYVLSSSSSHVCVSARRLRFCRACHFHRRSNSFISYDGHSFRHGQCLSYHSLQRHFH